MQLCVITLTRLLLAAEALNPEHEVKNSSGSSFKAKGRAWPENNGKS